MIDKSRVNLMEWELAEEIEVLVLGENLSHCRFIHKSHMNWSGIEPGPSYWKDWLLHYLTERFKHINYASSNEMVKKGNEWAGKEQEAVGRVLFEYTVLKFAWKYWGIRCYERGRVFVSGLLDQIPWKAGRLLGELRYLPALQINLW
jgi:hypothetical protein